MDFRIEVITKYLPLLLQGMKMTIRLTSIAVAIGTIIGLFISLLRLSRFKPIGWLAKSYVDFFRGTPLLVQIFLVHYGLPRILGIQTIPAYITGSIALSINSGAYVSEIFRAGIQSIHRGQMEAARSLGMTYGQAMYHIILPQAFKRSIPPLGNEFIAMLKDSSLVSVIALQELTQSGRIMLTRSFRPLETWIPVSLLYLAMTLTITQFVSYLERRFAKDDHGE